METRKIQFSPCGDLPPTHTPHLRRREGETLGLVRGGHSSRNAYDGAGAVGAAGTVDTIASSHDFSSGTSRGPRSAHSCSSESEY